MAVPLARRVLRSSVLHAVLIIATVMFVAPLVWLVLTSLKSNQELFAYPPQVLPATPLWSNYVDAVNYIPFGRYMFNSFYIAVLNVIATVVSCAFVAYGFARIQWPGRNAVFIVVLATLMIPGEVVLIPQFVLFQNIGWVNTFNPLIIPAWAGSPVYIFLMRQFYLTLPAELSDAARIDGANEFQIFWRVMLPLAKPAVTAVAILTFVSQWNSFLGPLIYLNDERLYPLAIGLSNFFSSRHAEWALLMAAVVIMILPVLALFFVFQRNFIEGIQLTGRSG